MILFLQNAKKAPILHMDVIILHTWRKFYLAAGQKRHVLIIEDELQPKVFFFVVQEPVSISRSRTASSSWYATMA